MADRSRKFHHSQDPRRRRGGPSSTPRTPSPTPIDPSLKSADQVPFAAAWNLISLPKEPADSTIGTVLQSIGGQYDEVWTYDACDSADPWKFYDPNDLPSSDLGTLDHQPGIWLHGTSQTTLPVDGTVPASTTYQLCEGWNLIGYPSIEPRHPEAVLSPIDGKWVRLFGYDPFTPDDLWQGYDHQAPEWANNLPAMLPGRGYWLLVTEDTTLEISNQGAPPEVDLVTPEDLAVVTQPTDIVGTISSPLLQSWNLAYRAIGDADWQEIATGTNPAASETIGIFDPTLLLNGLYEIRLQAIDIAGQQVEETIAVSVEGNMKIGHFTLSFIDLAIPLSGLDIEIVRTYDSRQRLTQGDFGYGWSLDIRQGSYRNNRPTGDGWQIVDPGGPGITLPCSQIIETKSHLTVVRLSDQEVYRFRQVLKDLATVVGGCFARAEFEWVDGPLPGTTLEILGNDEVIYEGQGSRVIDRNTLELFEPEDVKLTTRDGRIFHLDLSDGVTHLEDLNGNTLEITADGITHSSGVGIDFERDAEGRIMSIVDPLNRVNAYAYDAAKDLIAFTDRTGAVTRFTYDSTHRLLDIEDPRGIKPILNEYDDQGRLVRQVDAFGKVIEFGHDRENRREVMTNRLGASRLLEYDTRGNVVRETDELGNVIQRTFNANDELLTQTDPLGRTSTQVYTASGDLASVTNAAGETTTYIYNSRGQLLAITDAMGGVATNVYDARGNPIRITDASGNERRFEFDATGNLLSIIDPQGSVTRYEFDAFGNQTKLIDPLGNEVVSTYDAVGNRLTATRTRTLPDSSSENLTTTFTYDALDRVTETVDADGSSTSTTWDLLGNILSRTDELGRQTSMTYDLMGRLSRIELPGGTAETRSYDAEGNVTAQTDPAGRITSFSYDAAGRPLSFTLPDGTSVSQIYDATGQTVATIDGRGHSTRFTYDLAGRQTEIIDPENHTVSVTYDGNGHRVAETNALGHVTRFAYDATGRLTTTTLPDDTTIVVGYDATGWRASETDPAGRTTRFAHDTLGRLISVTDALDQVASYSYDEVSNRVSHTDANGNTTRFEHDRAGRVTRKILPDGSTESNTYNADGTLASHTDSGGNTRTFEYDVNRRLVRRVYSDGKETTFTYTASGQRATVTDTRGMTAYTYDDIDRLIEKQEPAGHKLAHAYDEAGNRVSLTVTVGTQNYVTTYTYDSKDRVQTVTDALGRTTTFDYEANGNRTSLEFPNGVTASYEYDALDRLTKLRTETNGGDAIHSYNYNLDTTGRRTRVEEHDGTASHYLYDELYRLIQDQVTDEQGNLVYRHSYTYDSVSNRQNQAIKDADGSFSVLSAYDSRDRLLTSATTAYGWDVNGRRISRSDDATTTYTWDLDHRLLSVALPDRTVVENVYDADGSRVRKEVTLPSGQTDVTEYLVDTSEFLSHVVAEIVDGKVETLYTRAGGQLVNLIRPQSATQRHYHSDGLGSIRALSDGATDTVTDRYAYTAFGELLEHDGEDTNAYGFAGEQADHMSGLTYLRARWLDPTSGLFLSKDPFAGQLRAPMSLHRYNYAHVDPVNFADPSGQFLTVVGLGGLGALGLALFSVGTVSASVTQGEAWAHVKDRWDAYDEEQFRRWIKNEWVRYVGRKIDCADVAIDMVILFAAQRGLPLHFDAKEIQMDSKSSLWKGVNFREEAQDRLNARKVFERNTVGLGKLPGYVPTTGDLMMSKTHTRIFLDAVSGGTEYSYIAGDLWTRHPVGIPKAVIKNQLTPSEMAVATPSVRWWNASSVFRTVIP